MDKRLFKHAFLYALLLFLAVRIFMSLVLGLAALTIPPDKPPAPYEPSVVSDLESRGELWRVLVLPWYRWDTVHYINIATEGYQGDLKRTVWPPLYPTLIDLLDNIIQPSMLAGLLVANIAAIGALFMLYLLVTDVWGEKRARSVLVWMVIFPTGFFLLAGYTESLFLLFAAASLLMMRRRRWWLAGILGALATLTRLPGVFLAAPMLWEAWQAYRGQEARQRLRSLASAGAAAALMPLAMAVFSLWVRFGLGAAWPWDGLEQGWNLRFAMPWEGIFGTLQRMALEPVDLRAMSKFFDVLLALWALLLLAIGLRRLPFQYTLYALALLIPSLTKILDNNTLMSLSRYVLPIFPLFVLHDRVLISRGTRILVAAVFLTGQVLLAFMFYRWMWVA